MDNKSKISYVSNVLRSFCDVRSSLLIRNTIICVAIVVFCLFFVVGYNRPYIENMSYNDPLLTWPLLAFVFVVVLAAMATVIWSMTLTARHGTFADKQSNNIPLRRIVICVAGFVALLMLITFLAGSSGEILINGAAYSKTFWLKVADMFIVTSGTMIIMALALVVYSSLKNKTPTLRRHA